MVKSCIEGEILSRGSRYNVTCLSEIQLTSDIHTKNHKYTQLEME